MKKYTKLNPNLAIEITELYINKKIAEL